MNHSALFYLSLIVLSGVLALLLFIRVTIRGTFFQDVVREKNARLRLVKLLLQNLGTYEKKPMFTRKRPLFFRSSNRLFKQRTPCERLFLGLVVVIRTQAWLGGLVMVPIAILLGYYSANKVSLKS